MNKNILITGTAGFIGSELVKKLIKEEKSFLNIICVDNLSSYYDVNLKKARLECINELARSNLNVHYEFHKFDLSNKKKINALFKKYKFNLVVNLAAQAGVRYSIENPDSYIISNLIGFYNILEACRNYRVNRLVFASSSSVYGNSNKFPYSEDDKTDSPVSLYAATKKCDEILAYSYAKLYGIKCTGLRFFTVYGPFGRPDMAYFSFTKKIINHEKIKVFNYGNCLRDFTYIDDIVEGIYNIINADPSFNGVPFAIYNIGNNHPEKLLDFVNILFNELKNNQLIETKEKVEDYIELVPMQPGDVEVTYANVDKLQKNFNFKPSVSLQDGLKKFVAWYKDFYCKEF